MEDTGKGLVAGHLRFKNRWSVQSAVVTDVSHFPNGMPIPVKLTGIRICPSAAQFVLVVEKEAVFQRLLEENILNILGPMILVTGKGYPDMATRILLYQISEQLRIPLFAIVDSDPNGIEIASIYKNGSLTTNRRLIDSHQLLIPDLILLGLLPSECDTLTLPAASKIPLSERDQRKLASMAGRIKTDKPWLEEIKTLSENGFKVKIEALAEISEEFLTKVYLKRKLSSYMKSGLLQSKL